MIRLLDGTYVHSIRGSNDFGELVTWPVQHANLAHERPERDYYSYVARVFREEMDRVASIPAQSKAENEALNRRFWKLSEREIYYRSKASKY